MRREYHIEGTAGIKIIWDGVTYTTLEDIHFELDDEPSGIPLGVQPCAACSADDPAVMWGAGDDSADWLEPVIYWAPMLRDELEAWESAGDWSANIDGVLTSDPPEK